MIRFILIISAFLTWAGTHVVSAQVADKYLALADSADNYIKRERYADAERVIVEALRTDPANQGNHLLFSNLGIVRTHLGDIEGALQAYEIGLARAPNSTTLHTNRAYTYLAAGRTDDALEDFNMVLGRDSIREWPLKMRGIILTGKRKYAEAKADFEMLHRHYPRSDYALIGLGRIAMAEGKNAEAEDFMRSALKLDKSEEAYFCLIICMLEQGKLTDAGEVIREAMKVYPQDGNLFLARARLHQLSYRNDDALVDKKMAIEYGADSELVQSFFPSQGK